MPLAPPPRNAQGEVLPHDHDGILPDDGIIRRIPSRHVIDDDKIGGRRISSMAFEPSSGLNGGMSVDLQRLIEEAGHNAREFVISSGWVGAVRFNAADFRREGLQVGFDPLIDNLYHGEVWGKFTRAKKRKLLQLCKWFVEIPNVSIDGSG